MNNIKTFLLLSWTSNAIDNDSWSTSLQVMPGISDSDMLQFIPDFCKNDWVWLYTGESFLDDDGNILFNPWEKTDCLRMLRVGVDQKHEFHDYWMREQSRQAEMMGDWK